MSDAQVTQPNVAQLQGSNEYLSVMVDTLQGQLNEAHSKLTTAQTNATILQRANQRAAAQISDLQGKLATVLTPEVVDNNPALAALKGEKAPAADATTADAAPTSSMPKLSFPPGARAAGLATAEADNSASASIPAPDAKVTH